MTAYDHMCHRMRDSLPVPFRDVRGVVASVRKMPCSAEGPREVWEKESNLCSAADRTDGYFLTAAVDRLSHHLISVKAWNGRDNQ